MFRLPPRRAAAVAIALALAAPSVVAAQTPPVAPLRHLLDDGDALAEWLATHSHDVAAEAARVTQARALVDASRLRPNPQLTASLGGVPAGTTNPPDLGFGDTVNYGASLAQLVEIGKRGPRTDAARLRLDGERHTLAASLVDAASDARDVIARVFFARARLAALTDSRELARQIVELQRVRLDRGDLSGVDFDRLQLDTQLLDADVAQAHADVDDALASCASVLFASCDDGQGVDGADLSHLVDTAAGSLQAPSLTERPDLQALDAAQRAAGVDAQLALKRRVPDPIVSLGYTRDRFVVSGNNPKTVALGVTIPLPTFDRGKADAARALAAQRELLETAAAITTRAQSDLAALRARETALAASLAALQGSALGRADSILTTTADAVNQGELSTTDLLLARRARTDVALKVMDLQLQLYSVRNAERHLQGLDAPAARRAQGTTWPTP